MGVKLSYANREHNPGTFENRVLKNVLRLKRDEVTGSGEDCIMRSSVTCTPHQILPG